MGITESIPYFCLHMRTPIITTKYIEDYVYESSNEQGNKVTIDMRDGAEKEELNAPELLLAALAGCVVVDIVLIMKKKRRNVADILVETDGERKETYPRGFTTIHLKFILVSADATEKELDKASRLSLEKYCTVADTIKADIEYSVEIRRP